MNPQFKYKNHVLLMALAALYPLTGFAAGAARVEFVTGSVTAVNAAGVQRELSRGAELETGDAVRTGANARAQLRFTDGGMMSIQPGTEFRIDNYKFDGKADGTERGFFSVVKGGLRAISGTIGHGQDKDNYRVSTPVATIGIRGTEYFLVYTGGDNGQLSVRTGEGAIVVQNAGGAIVVPSGGAAVVTGSNTSAPQQTNTFIISSGTSSAPAVVTAAAAPVATTENRTSSGSLAVLASAGGLQSGPGYAAALSFLAYGRPGATWTPAWSYNTSATTVFDSGLKLLSVSYGGEGIGDSYVAGTVTSAFVLDGVIGWGSWSSGSEPDSSWCPSGSCALQNVHYVVGTPTSTSDLSNLSGSVATYTLAGYTTPTSSTGATFAGNYTASFVANFSAGNATTSLGSVPVSVAGNHVAGVVQFDMNVGSSTYTVNSGTFSGALPLGEASFTASGTPSVSIGSSSLSLSSASTVAVGILAGANASHAGLTYTINTGTSPVGTVNGAAVFTQSSVVTPAP